MSTTQITLRPATEADIPALAALGRESFVAKFGHMYSAADLSAFLEEVHSYAAIGSDLANPDRAVQLAETSDGALAGYCKLGLSCGWPEHARGRNAIELKQLYADPAMIGMGIGAKLMDWALEVARQRGADEMQLSVWSGNTDAQRFYARYGFAKAADIHFMVGEQRDEEFLFARLI